MILLWNSPPKFTETMFLDTVVYKGTRLNEKVILDVKTTETFQHTFWGLSPTDLSKEIEESVSKFKRTLDGWWWTEAIYQHNLKDKLQSEINETHRNWSPRSWNKTEQGRKRNVAFLDTIGNLRTTTKFTTTTSVDWEKTGTRTSVSAGKRKLKMRSVGRSTTTTLNVNTNVKLWCAFATKFFAMAPVKTMRGLIFKPYV